MHTESQGKKKLIEKYIFPRGEGEAVTCPTHCVYQWTAIYYCYLKRV